MRRLVLAMGAAVVALPLTASAVLAHPLGNFTINHYTGIRVEPDRVLLDVVIDAAEIPTFQATAALDRDGDGALSSAETAGLPGARCRAIGQDLDLAADGASEALRLIGAGVTFPMGNGGLPTMRTACAFEAPFAVAPGRATTITFSDGYEAARIGWREITVVGDRMSVSGDGVPQATVSDRLRAYPAGLASAPDVRAVALTVQPGGPALAPFAAPDAPPTTPLEVGGAAGAESANVGSTAGTVSAGSPGSSAGPGLGATAVPGGAEAIPAILGQVPVGPYLALLAMLTAALLGAGHALTPGHGKTLMAAYLVGTRGTPRHALGLGLAVSVSHTAGILGLAIVILAAESALPADVVVRAAPVVAAVSILVIGAWMLATELRRRHTDGAATSRTHAHDHGSDHAHAHGADHAHEHDYGSDHAHAHDHAHADTVDLGPEPDRPSVHAQRAGLARVAAEAPHRHGPITHTHLPQAGATVTWRGLFLLGLAGGLVPSANALLVLLGSIAAGRPAWGVVLVAAFGLGMAAVMAGIGLACVYARGLVDRVPARLPLRAVGRLVPLGAAALVLAIGVVLTTQAVAAARLG